MTNSSTNQWQPIETAPKDGTSIILGCDYDRRGRQRVTLAWYERGMWAEGMYWDDDADDWSVSQCEFRPSHWMPLPPPPHTKELSDEAAGGRDE